MLIYFAAPLFSEAERQSLNSNSKFKSGATPRFLKALGNAHQENSKFKINSTYEYQSLKFQAETL